MNEVEKIFIEPLLDENGKIKVPDYANQIKIDVGLSLSAPNATKWIEDTDDRHVFAFEPNWILNPFSNKPRPNYLTTPLEIRSRYTYMSCGLDDIEEGCVKELFLSKADAGRSSLYKPLWDCFEFAGVMEVSLIPFKLFLERLPWDRFECIEQLKTDTQGNDLRILQNAGEYLKKVAYLDVESTCYINAEGVGEYEYFPTREETTEYIESMGFELIASPNAIDQVYFNFANYSHLYGKLHHSLVA